MKTGLATHFEKAMEEIASQRALFREAQERKLKRLAPEWRQAVERGEGLLREAQRLKIQSEVSFLAPIGRGRERTKQAERTLKWR
jgi:hypothetical protein